MAKITKSYYEDHDDAGDDADDAVRYGEDEYWSREDSDDGDEAVCNVT